MRYLAFGFWRALSNYWHFEQTVTDNSRIEKPLTKLAKALKFYIAIRSWHKQAQGKTKLFYRHRQSIETSASGFWKALGAYWYFKQTITNNSRIIKPLTTWTNTLELYIAILSYTFTTLDTLRMISIEAYGASIGRFYSRLKYFTNAQNIVSIRSWNIHIILLLLLFLLYLAILLRTFFALFMLVTIDVVYVNTVRFILKTRLMLLVIQRYIIVFSI